MKIYNDIEQGSETWMQLRAGKITASRCKDARDRLKNGNPSQKCIGYAAQVALERIAKKPVDKVFENWQMREGSEQEPLARMMVEAVNGYIVEEVGAIATDDDVFQYSPDGLVGDDGLIEIKSLFSPERIVRIVGEGDISDFVDQCNFGLWLTGRQWIDLAIWVPSLEPVGKHITIHRIERNEDEIQKMEDDLIWFKGLVEQYHQTLTK